MYKLLAAFIPIFICSILRAQKQATNPSDSSWSFSLSGFYYIIPDDKNSTTLIGTADHNRLHFEGRYNYEDRKTGSLFAGWRLEAGKKLQFAATPMAGMIFGNTNGAAPGLELELNYKKADFYSETEYVFDFSGVENSFLYTWGELGFSPIEALRMGFVYQRTRLYHNGFEVQKGLFTLFSFWKLTAGSYCFNPFSKDDIFIASVSIDF